MAGGMCCELFSFSRSGVEALERDLCWGLTRDIVFARSSAGRCSSRAPKLRVRGAFWMQSRWCCCLLIWEMPRQELSALQKRGKRVVGLPLARVSNTYFNRAVLHILKVTV